MSPSALHRRLLLSGTMLAAAVGGYGRRAYGACAPAVAPNYLCSGANVTTQLINANNASVSTLAGFSVNTATGNAITITGDGALSYTDTNASPLTAATGTALDVRSLADFAGTPGSITINTNGALSSTEGIFAHNYGSGALTITVNGGVTGTSDNGIYARTDTGTLTVTTGTGTTVSGTDGIFARNYGSGALTVKAYGDVTGGTSGYGIYTRNGNYRGTDLSVTTGTGTTVRGGAYGIYAGKYGSGALTINALGNVTGTSRDGIFARNFAGTDLSVTTAAGTTVNGGITGILARNYGTGRLTVTANGDVMGTSGSGISASNLFLGTDLSVTTAAGTTVNGGIIGILARNYGSGALSVTANGDVTGTSGNGIYARNLRGTDLSVTTAAGTTVNGGSTGIFARNEGSGALTITANGDVTGTSGNGIYARNYRGSNLSVTTAAGAAVNGGTDGIHARNDGTGAVTVTANGDVTGISGSGIYARNFRGTDLSVTTAASTTVSGNTGIYARNAGPLTIAVGATSTVTGTGGTAIAAAGGPATVTVAGTINGAISFDQAGAFANRLDLVTGAVIDGNVLGGTGSDTLGLGGTGSGSFNVGQLVSFEAGAKTESGSWTLTGANAGITAFSVGAGTLLVNGSMGNAAFSVTGGTLGGSGTVGNTLISGGTFAPGSGTPGSSMTVHGTLGFDAAAIYAISLNPTASFADVSGAATLGGATVNAVWANGGYVAKHNIILTAGSVSGTFNPTVANTNLPGNFHDALSYDATHAYLDLTLNFQVQGGNQQAVANTLVDFFNSNGRIPLVFGTLTPGGLSQLSGETATGSQASTFSAMSQFMGLLTDPFIDGRGDGANVGGGASRATGYASTQEPATIRDAYAMFTKAAPPSQPSPASGPQAGEG